MFEFRKLKLILLLSTTLFIFACRDEETGIDPAGDPDYGSGDDNSVSAPVITDFSLPDGNLTDSGTVTISITDDDTATAWMITESENAPEAASSDWLSTKPSTHTISSFGAYNLYAWAKNSGGTVGSGKGPVSAEYINGPEAGNIIITEIMANPNILDDSEGEWFEIFNTSGETFNLKGCIFNDAGTDSFTISADFEISPAYFATLARSAEPGFTADYIFQNFSLTNSVDEITLTSLNGVVIDTVSYTGSTEGVSTKLQLCRKAVFYSSYSISTISRPSVSAATRIVSPSVQILLLFSPCIS